MMPRLSGAALILHMHERLDLAVPTILMNAVPPATMPSAAFLPKPFDLDELVGTIRALAPVPSRRAPIRRGGESRPPPPPPQPSRPSL